ncbi:DinB family protein [Georgenia thermotolerans]|uniref:DUF664 domain-containing protein n=1 Tax=Georgenia thermotolerans TaxID=527326 RepID=A0A7J5ULX5_9MICO|nr:DinB family protein [Georgenia thermotolerans]KAE8763104.1 DUF664 domain-containing protein [Georgenia thermotolerans]
METLKDDLGRYLDGLNDALLWKLDGLGEYDLRRPLTPTGTNLLGLVKHVAGVEAGYLGEVFDRPFPERYPWMEDDAEDNADMWATAEESAEWITDLFGRVRAHCSATIAALDLDAEGYVPWWGEQNRHVTLGRILVHVTTEVARHAGHADIVREKIDGASGLRPSAMNLPTGDGEWWGRYTDRLERVAREVAAPTR